jgi:hypothetical protein
MRKKVTDMNWIKLAQDRLDGNLLINKIMNPQFLLEGGATVSFSRIFEQFCNTA